MFPTDICKLIYSYTEDRVLRDWIDEKKINWHFSSLNINDGAIKLLEENPDKIKWDELSRNTNIFIRDKRILEMLLSV